MPLSRHRGSDGGGDGRQDGAKLGLEQLPIELLVCFLVTVVSCPLTLPLLLMVEDLVVGGDEGRCWSSDQPPLQPLGQVAALQMLIFSPALIRSLNPWTW